MGLEKKVHKHFESAFIEKSRLAVNITLLAPMFQQLECVFLVKYANLCQKNTFCVFHEKGSEQTRLYFDVFYNVLASWRHFLFIKHDNFSIFWFWEDKFVVKMSKSEKRQKLDCVFLGLNV